MLDTETKRRIDNARDILVGKVPDPKSQVEQITIALIYKFMDDMDADSEELGGKRKFFAGDYAHYGWARLMHAGLGGHEMLNLYAEAITTMPENPGIPPLFRDIFKNAYLPYRDPETLKSFLKIIDEFSYDHSERLGDAFEYLLSVLGSQGDAGQFRTPRHIIDFMVELVDPKKTDTVLDPACGTAGFLISSWKHILKANTDAEGQNTLNHDDRERLARNFIGYDISPDMVRLSLVNLYLHGFADPHIFEYDSLTSQDRWNETADVILANPPFMSPKGGIKPHNRFSVQSKRSEVLFVDYMAEHLSANGRAGIIVPEGVIFQSQTAYKKLRKLLVDESLVAVVSLPAGLFQPYSGVKTSILILDKSLAKRSASIGFFKISNDGFGLGAQRRAIDKNDLPQAQAEIGEYLRRLRAGESVEDFEPALGLIVAKEKVAAGGDYNLSGERYRNSSPKSHLFTLIKIGDVCATSSGGTPLSGKAAYYEGGTIPWLRSGEVAQGPVFRSELFITEEALKNSSAKLFPVDTVLVAMYGATAGEVGILRFACTTNQAICGILPGERLVPEFLYLLLKANKPALIRLAGGGAQPNISQKIIREFQVPLPPLDVQQEIVAEIEGYQKVIDGARAVLDNYRPHIPIHSDWPTADLKDVCEVISDGDHQPPPKSRDGVPFVTISNIDDRNQIDFSKTFFVSREYYEGLKSTRRPQRGDILYTVTGSYGIPVLVESDREFCFQRHIGLIRPDAAIVSTRYLYTLLLSPFMKVQADEAATGVAQKTVALNSLRGFKVPLPSRTTQEAVAAEIEAEQALVNANRELIARFEKKIAATLARIWGDHDAA
ncbi:hypothetical protein ASD68_00755 [Rhodanobacter sp. Root627]|uniref:N-6 DNA methylase n=1 Tax=Rhodanobacter sp. Root627 TaxID=1736572 RepID=UPI000700AD91|nr:N-6 DNA methylase [Rhodanobacter sp. Root627]KRA35029.1 hypothetical protein ASD68_00755 [Rhodanobacter sp. Root627]